MPTPFYHLSLAQELVEEPGLPQSVLNFLIGNQAEFLFGNIAPDVQVVSGQARAETHFFELPVQKNLSDPWESLWKTHPQLRLPSIPDSSQRAFMLGYLCHLYADWQWIKQIFSPVFGLDSAWGTFQERLIWHNVLRAELDEKILPTINPHTAEFLAKVIPNHWLPFVQDGDLVQWRDQIARQLQPDKKIETIAVLAARQNIPIEEFESYLTSEEKKREMIFNHVNQTELDSFRSQLIIASRSFIQVILLHPKNID